MVQFKRILITGATGSIGQALAVYYAQDGVELVLQGRDVEKLKHVSERCRQLGAAVEAGQVDLTDQETMFAWLEAVCTNSVPDLVIANAGMNISNGLNQVGESQEQLSKLIDLNVKSTLQMLNYLAKQMKQRRSGQIAIISSLAGYHGLPITPSYSASKAAVKAYGEGIRGWLAPDNVGVTVVMPGYVKSEMCDTMEGPKPFLWQPEKAAKVIARGIGKNKARISFPFPLNLGSWLLSVIPAPVAQFFLRLLHYTG